VLALLAKNHQQPSIQRIRYLAVGDGLTIRPRFGSAIRHTAGLTACAVNQGWSPKSRLAK
jgi:hypothetical protein